MNIVNRHFRQQGFFDLGLGLALFTLFGTTAYVTTPETSGTQAIHAMLQQEECQTVDNEQLDCKSVITAPTVNQEEEL